MPVTPVYAFPYPSLSDPPNGSVQLQALAEALEDEIIRVDNDVTDVREVTDLLASGATLNSVQNTSGTTTSTSYTETLTGGTACSLVFVAPPSGKVIVHNSSSGRNSTTARVYVSWIIRTGGSVGSGSTFLDAGDNGAITVVGTSEIMVGRANLVTGLTAGNTYNIRQRFRNSSASTGTFDRKELIVAPVWQ